MRENVGKIWGKPLINPCIFIHSGYEVLLGGLSEISVRDLKNGLVSHDI